MTTGQRIAARRKELGLSQEGLGTALGVSRQAIYKWEADASLPEIDKLIALSRLFHVPVGWLLGVEEEVGAAEAAPEGPAPFTPEQEKLVEEILSRYQAGTRKKNSRRPVVIAGLVLGAAVVLFNNRISGLERQYNSLSNSIWDFTSSVDRQIGSITTRVEEILKTQNSLTADYGTQLTGTDLFQNTASFSLRVVPRTYTEGMEVSFLCDWGEGPEEYPGVLGSGQEFTGEITCPLTDCITLSAVFRAGDTRQTQLLDSYGGLYQRTLPEPELMGFQSVFLDIKRGQDGLFHLEHEECGWIQQMDSSKEYGLEDVAEMRVGLFRNFQPLTWLEPCEKPERWEVDSTFFFRLDPIDLDLKEGDTLVFATVFTDRYGRQGVTPTIPWCECAGDEMAWPVSSNDATPFFDLSNYKFDP